jgi:phenylpropionate dioxygenase-like ring-hydroxylating dioxygenase large terminal subunit
MGELLRRYWHPVGLVDARNRYAAPVRVLGEDLILFRDGAGRAGWCIARCCHRGTTLYYGKVEERGIRCCYHGWLFDTQGAASSSRASRKAGRSATRCASPGIRSRSATA